MEFSASATIRAELALPPVPVEVLAKRFVLQDRSRCADVRMGFQDADVSHLVLRIPQSHICEEVNER